KHERPAAKHLRAKDENVMEIDEADVAELVDARDLKSLDGNVVWVRVPPPAPAFAREASKGCHAEAQAKAGFASASYGRASHALRSGVAGAWRKRRRTESDGKYRATSRPFRNAP